MPKRKSDRDGLFKRPDSPFWQFSVTDPQTGRRRRCSTRTTDRREAERVRSRYQLQGEARAERWTLIAVAEELLAEKQRQGEDDYVRTRLSVLRAITRCVPPDTVMPVPVSMVRQMIADMLDAGIKPNTINHRLQFLGRLHRYGNIELGQAWQNPVTGRMMPYRPRDQWLTREQAGALYQAAQQQPVDWLADYVLLGLQTGLRPDEQRRLRRDQIDLGHGIIRFAVAETKSRRPDSVPLNRTARQIIANRPIRGEWVFSQPDGRCVTRRTLAWYFERAVQAAGVPHCTPHVLRHTCASWLVQDGVPIADVSRLLRHADVTTTARVYAHLSPDQARRAADSLDRHVIVTLPGDKVATG